VGAQAELDRPVVAPLVDLVVHPAHLDVTAECRVLVAEHARLTARRRRAARPTHVTRTPTWTLKVRYRRSLRSISRPSSSAPGSQVARTIAGSAFRYSSTSRRAIDHGPPSVGSPGGSSGNRWLSASTCQPSAGVRSWRHSSRPMTWLTCRPSSCWARWTSCRARCHRSRAGDAPGSGPRASRESVMA
jgi:hypothetical protein